METALLGYDLACSNGALIIEKFNPFSQIDLDVQKMKQTIVKDPIYQALSKTKNFVPPNIDGVLHEDILEILTNLKYDSAKKESVLSQLTKVSSNIGHDYSNYLTVELLQLGIELLDPLSLLKLGDLYQSGSGVKQNYTLAYEQYSKVGKLLTTQNDAVILAHAYYNMAYMDHYGLGREKNLTNAIHYYNLSMMFEKNNIYMIVLNKKLAEWEKDYFDKYLNETGSDATTASDLTLQDILKLKISQFEEQHAKKVFVGFLLLAALVLFLVRLRLQNYQSLYLKEHAH